jgi:two-component system chemotaxis sensor kinase CheA
VEWFQETPVYRLRGKLLPLVRLDRLFEKCERSGGSEATPIEDKFIVVLNAESHQFGILVHSVQDTQEIVVKPLSKHLKSSLFAGATIMGDGKVALIMDVPGLAQHALLTRGVEDIRDQDSARGLADKTWVKESMLLVECNMHGLMAVPVANISRLQELPSDSIEKMANMEVFQSRGRILPMLRLARLLTLNGNDEAVPALIKKGTLRVLVYTDGDRSAGFVVDRILDIVDVVPDIHLPAGRPGFKGSTLIKGKATEILDLPELAKMALPSLFFAQDANEMGD